MSLILKDDLIKACADAYRTASGTTERVKAGELAGLVKKLTAGSGASDIYIGEYTPSSDVEDIEVLHGFISSDILAAVIFAETIDAENPPSGHTLCTAMLTAGYNYYATSSSVFDNVLLFGFKCRSDGTAQQCVITGQSLEPDIDKENGRITFKSAATNTPYASGVTYTVIIIPESAKEAI